MICFILAVELSSRCIVSTGLQTPNPQRRMAVARYENDGDASTQRLKHSLLFHFSKRTMKNRLFKASMGETLASWDFAQAEACGIPTKGLIELYQR